MQLTTEQRDFILKHEREDVRELALRFSREDLPFVLSQIAGRQMAADKIFSWYERVGMVYPPHFSIEQASSEIAARYKSSLVPQGLQSFADLTGGMGVDFSFFAPKFQRAVYVERDAGLCEIARANFRCLGLENAEIHCSDGETFLREAYKFDFVFLDPSRRDDAGRKVFRMEDCSPDLTAIKTLLLEKSGAAMVKYSPMLDISQALKGLGRVAEVHIVSVDNECKELLFVLSETSDEEPRCLAVNLKKSGDRETFSFALLEERQATIPFAKQLQRYLYEPNASILKAGAFKSVAKRYGVEKLQVNSHLYTSERLIVDFPGRIFEIADSCVPNKRELKSFLSGVKKANIAVRNFPMTVAEIRKKTGLENGGDVYLFATTLADERKVWVKCRKVLVRR
ncbi:MAG: SAM-dependent methyltransferase [Dysgonamonadaceae bacterium]|jgi:hypothetical protein|nr:SAM-dependent methyltransferase [Dysgonamonadaceae bacterium]